MNCCLRQPSACWVLSPSSTGAEVLATKFLDQTERAGSKFQAATTAKLGSQTMGKLTEFAM